MIVGVSVDDNIKKYYSDRLLDSLKPKIIGKYKFVPKFKTFPNICRKLKLGVWVTEPMHTAGRIIKMPQIKR